MAIVFQKDKRSGITYAYESKSHWDKEKKQSRAKRKLIGRVNEKTGEVVPTKGTNRKDKQEKVSFSKRGPVPATEVSRNFYCMYRSNSDTVSEIFGHRIGDFRTVYRSNSDSLS